MCFFWGGMPITTTDGGQKTIPHGGWQRCPSMTTPRRNPIEASTYAKPWCWRDERAKRSLCGNLAGIEAMELFLELWENRVAPRLEILLMVHGHELRLPAAHEALPGRALPLPVAENHFVLGTPMQPPFPGMELVLFGMGCFWGAEKSFWSLPGVHSTQVGFAGGFTKNPTYREVCTGLTAHTEVVRVVFDPRLISFKELLVVFWEGHDPTQGWRQGADVGTQYRSAIYLFSKEHGEAAVSSREHYQEVLTKAGFGPITTEILSDRTFYYAEVEHQQYLAKHPGGSCGSAGTGVGCPMGLGAS